MKKFNIHTKSTLVVLFIALITINVFSQSGWVELNSGTTNSLKTVQFPTESTGYVIPYVLSPLLKTINSGTNWSQIASLPYNVSYISWVNETTGYNAGNHDLYKTTNGGLNWQNFNQSNIAQVSFINESTGWMTDNEPDYLWFYVRVTTNGGTGWNSIWQFGYTDPPPIELFYFSNIYALNLQTLYFSCYWESILSGQRWTRIYRIKNGVTSYFGTDTIMMSINPLSIPSADTAYTTARSWLTPYFYHVLKGVNNIWTSVFTVPYGMNISSINFPNNNTGYVIASKQHIYKTTDGAATWNLIRTDSVHALNSIYFVNGITGYAVGDGGYIIKTTTGGETPIIHSVSGTVRYQDNNQPVSSGYVKALSYNSQNQQITVVDSAAIQSNGTYMLQNCPPITLDIMAYENDEEEASFVPTYYVSTIYWENATQVTPDSNLTGIDISVFRINNISGNYHIGGGVYSAGSEDEAALKDAFVYARIGNVFKGYSLSGSTGAYRIDSLSSGIYEVICNRMGYYSAVRPFQLTTFSVDTIDFVLSILLVSVEHNMKIPEKYWLSQNYPNPFNPQTKIKFGLPEQSYVKLTVYDILGREVGRLIDKDLRAGEYNVSWDASRLASGIYFYRLETDRYTETRKMVLMK